ncbi:MAG: helix-turn-helix transcriptional regulator, partial [Deltaproteobacteria bacterium]|nr:helix-turn-helix transcriptional regulator [Deltaproteobacteria bacterium]
MTKEMMSTKDVAEYLNINEKQVYKLIKETNIPATRITGKWTFPKSLIDEWIINSAKKQASMQKAADETAGHVVIMGSNDFSLEILSHELTGVHPEFSLSLSNVGSLEGLTALGRGACTAASCHLFDPETGTYNAPYIPKYLPGTKVDSVNIVFRDLGLIVKAGNPAGITGIKDLAGDKVTFVNRQKGAGTRRFLDAELERLGLRPEQIAGYDRIATTHADVAIAVMSGTA